MDSHNSICCTYQATIVLRMPVRKLCIFNRYSCILYYLNEDTWDNYRLIREQHRCDQKARSESCQKAVKKLAVFAQKVHQKSRVRKLAASMLPLFLYLSTKLYIDNIRRSKYFIWQKNPKLVLKRKENGKISFIPLKKNKMYVIVRKTETFLYNFSLSIFYLSWYQNTQLILFNQKGKQPSAFAIVVDTISGAATSSSEREKNANLVTEIATAHGQYFFILT